MENALFFAPKYTFQPFKSAIITLQDVSFKAPDTSIHPNYQSVRPIFCFSFIKTGSILNQIALHLYNWKSF